jgi:hypothetical protein
VSQDHEWRLNEKRLRTIEMQIAQKSARPHVEVARIGQLTQGTVFNCATAFRYPGKQVYGLTITARCDVAQEKYRLLNYIPVVPLEEWLIIDGLEILMGIEKKEQSGKIKNELKQNNLTPNLLISVPLDDIIETHFPSSDRKNKKTRDRLISIKNDIQDLSALDLNPELCFDWFVQNRPKLVSGLIGDLFNHKVLGYYFLERLSPSSKLDGFVCLLREVCSLPREVAEELANGLSKERWDSIPLPVRQNNLDFSVEDFAAPLFQLGSPSIEHLMQVYANLFGRIGISDPQEEEVVEIVSRLNAKRSIHV